LKDGNLLITLGHRIIYPKNLKGKPFNRGGLGFRGEKSPR